ncbi:MAG: TAT-variant-translocated molybdopterin oxidoreductase [Phycisphaerales bacterium]
MPSLNRSSSTSGPAGGPLDGAIDLDAAPDETAGCGSVGLRKDGASRRPIYWRSVDDLAESAEFKEILDREFPSAATDLVTADDRRQFIKVMGASFALAGLAMSGCRRWPDTRLAPYASRPEGRAPGQTVQYATMTELDGCAVSLLATSFDGRPIKLDGNPDHPLSGGASDAFTQAAILGLYDQDRSRDVFHDGKEADFHDFATFAAGHFRGFGPTGTKGAGLAFLSEPTSSPTMHRLRDELAKAMPGATWVEWAPVNDDNERLGTTIAFGAPQRVHLTFQQDARSGGRPVDAAREARVVLSLDADFLRDHPAAVRHAREYARTRRVATSDPKEARVGRLYMLDSGGTITGVAADERLAMRAVDVGPVAAAIAKQVLDALGSNGGVGSGEPVAAALSRLAGAAGAAKALDARGLQVIGTLVRDLLANKGSSLVVAGRQQPPEVHAIAALLNERLGNIGRTVSYVPEPDPKRPSNVEALRQLRDALVGGSVDTLVVLGGNPSYDAAADLDFAAAMKKAKHAIHLGVYRDETARLCAWHLPRAHWLESWGDARSHDGTYTIAQPLIAPMIEPGNGGLSALELVSTIIDWSKGAEPAAIGRSEPGAMAAHAEATAHEPAHGAPARPARRDGILANQLVGQDLVKATVAAMTGATGVELDRRWRALVHDGFLPGSAPVAGEGAAAVRTADVAKAIETLAAQRESIKPDSLEVVFRADAKVHDGRFSNNGWLQELPEPVTKVTWDNAAVMSLGTAKSLGVERNDMIRIEVGGRSLDMAVLPLPGHPDHSIWVTLGYGRGPEAGRIADAAGFNTYAIRTTGAMNIAPGAKATKIAGTYRLVSTQDRGAGNPVAEAGAQDRLPTIVREGTIAHWGEHPDFARHPDGFHVAHRLSLWEESNLDGAKHRWAMSVDLSTCIGCNACAMACQAENNIPVVGKEQVRRGREMAWIRIDRYFKGADPAHPEATFFQPVTCLHCENAPCEQVCPVAATVHDEDGLNVMVYNRCVGTRYCSNNCPYKVRRFNYFDWHRKDPTRGNDWFQTQPDYFFREGPDRWKQMQFNPEVTVRMRGIMEKCTFCTQRIVKARIDAKNAWAKAGGREGGSPDFTIPDGAITPACAQACPSQAIVFGDLMDPRSRVSQLHRSRLSYELLEELNTKPRLKYLARISNPAIERNHGQDGGHGAGQHAAAPVAGANS